MALTTYALEQIGFKRLDQGESVKGNFTRVDVFSIQGITLNASFLPSRQDQINGTHFKMGIGSSLNSVCRDLTGDDFFEDEEEWKEETKSRPPFLLLSFGPTDEYASSGTHFKERDDIIETYDSFLMAKNDLRARSDAVTSNLLTALTLTFSSQGRSVRFLPCASAVAGKTIEGKTIIDWRLEFSGMGYVSSGLEDREAEEKSAAAIDKAKKINRDVARLYYLGSTENDPLKRFLQFFLCVERLVHSTFSAIDHQMAASSLFTGHARIEGSGQKLLNAHRQSWKDLKNRFIWCAMHRWNHLDDADVEQFERLKSIRDNISHGRLSVPDGGAVAEIEALALRIQGTT